MLRFLLILFLLTLQTKLLVAQKQKTNPENHDIQFFNQITQEALDSIPSLGAFLVWQNHSLVCEKYFNGANDSTAFSIKSVTKSITSALAGIACDKSLLPTLDTKVLDLFPEFRPHHQSKDLWYGEFIAVNDSLRNLLTLRHLLTMQCGFQWDDNNPLIHRPFQTSSDPVRLTLELPFETAPGTEFRYCTPASHLTGTIISKAIRNDLLSFADSFLFKPLDIHPAKWTCDAMGRRSGGSELYMSARDMLKFSLLYLNRGVINGKQILSSKWIAESTSEQVKLDYWDVLPNANGYGYYWWRRMSNNHQVWVASGYGGQLICIIPDMEMVVVTTCFVNEKNRGRSEIKRLHLLIDKLILAKN